MRGQVRETPRSYARCLRRDQTDAERKLWARLRDRRLGGAKFRRQQPIGRYVVDFCCPETKLVIELHGGQHATRLGADATRTAFLHSDGYRVLRFWNTDVLANIEGVLHRIAGALKDPHPDPLPERERESGMPLLTEERTPKRPPLPSGAPSGERAG